MKKAIIVCCAMISVACVAPPAPYRKDPTASQLNIDTAACNLYAAEARDSYFPRNPILMLQARREAFDLCMKSKGYNQG